MGCDIHGYIEAELCENSGPWNGLLDIEMILNRDYDTFAALFGVRGGYNNHLFGHRGLPENVSYRANADSEEYGENGHSRTHVTLAELEEVDPEQIAFRADPEMGTPQVTYREAMRSIQPVINVMRALVDSEAEGDPNRIRLVLWFDC